VTNSAIHHGEGLGIEVLNSNNVELTENIVADHVEHGIWVHNSQGITVDGNWIMHIRWDAHEEMKFKKFTL